MAPNPLKSTRTALSIVALFLTSPILASCKQLPPPPAIAIPAPPAEPTHLPAIDIFVDDSTSMAGFIGARGSRYQRTATTVVEQIITAGYQSRSIPFSGAVRGDSWVPLTSSQWRTQEFYRASKTPLARLLDRATDRTPNDRIIVIVSDLVQPDMTKRHHDLVDAIQRAAIVRPAVVLFAFRSAFRGRYVVESQPRRSDLLFIEFDGSTDTRSRPFYVLVLAPSPGGLAQFRRYVLDPLSPQQEFHASAPVFAVDKTEFVPEGEFGLYAPVEFLAPGQSGFLGTFVERHAPQGHVGQLRLRLSGVRRAPIVSVEKFFYETSTNDEKGQGWLSNVRISIKADGYFPEGRATGDLTRVSLLLNCDFPRPEPYRWHTYRVRVRAGPGNVIAPGWITQWSTRDDRLREYAHLTLDFRLVVEAMIQGISEKVILAEQYVRLGRGS